MQNRSSLWCKMRQAIHSLPNKQLQWLRLCTCLHGRVIMADNLVNWWLRSNNKNSLGIYTAKKNVCIWYHHLPSFVHKPSLLHPSTGTFLLLLVSFEEVSILIKRYFSNQVKLNYINLYQIQENWTSRNFIMLTSLSEFTSY